MKPFAIRLMLFALLVCVNVAVKAQDPGVYKWITSTGCFPTPSKRLT
jgi:hypothetical protein